MKLAVVDQTRDALPDDKTVWRTISGGHDILTVGKFEMPSRAYLGRFNFKGADQQKLVGKLSGGERGRLHLAKTLLAGGNVLLLDEPSNDLDVETLRALEDALLEFAGSVLVISHDRWFLDRIATHILAAEGDSQWVFFDGNYQEYEADKKKRLGEEGAQPHRLRFKPLGNSAWARLASVRATSRSRTVARRWCASPGGNGGPEEAGVWEFWTIVGPERGGDIGRCREGADPGERWRRMEGAKGYEKLYAWAISAAQYMRASSAAEVEVWLNKNQKDARFVESVEVAGQVMAIAAKVPLASAIG